MNNFFRKLFRQLHCIALLSIVFSSFSGSAMAASAFTVKAVTSAWYNTPLPPLPNADAAVNNLYWDVVPGTSQIKSSNLNHGGGWLAFYVDTYGSPETLPTATYGDNTPIAPIYFGTRYYAGLRRDIYYGPYNAGSVFKATLPSYMWNFYPPQMYIK